MIWYCVPGLGADDRVFQKLNLEDEIRVLRWVPVVKGESVSDYAKRMRDQIDTNEKFGLIGVSFGGLVVNELSKMIDAKKVVLVSSGEVKSMLKNDLVEVLMKLVPFHKINPSKSMIRLTFGPEKSSEEVLFKIIADTDKSFLEWALKSIQKYSFERNMEHILIIGDQDFFFKTPQEKNLKNIVLKGGAHFMIYDRADEISSIINTA